MTLDTFLCCDCSQEFPVSHNGGTGYAREPDTWRFVCYGCCGKRDRAAMIERGKATLYLTIRNAANEVTNWPGTLRFRTGAPHVSRHNIAGKRYDVWFTGPDGKTWHGVQYGDNTQICHCRRTKSA
jgi:hypothetical protein